MYTAMHARGRQPYIPSGGPGEPTKDPITLVQYKIGQVGPRAENRWNMSHGRNLAGLGGENETQAPWDPAYKEGSLRELEKDDDVYGSGIFDAYGHPGTINPTLGLFADHPSLPGFIDREVLYTVSKDISDSNGADVVMVAPGGMTYQERDGRQVDFDGRGNAPCPPRMRPAPYSKREDVYAALSPAPAPRPLPQLPSGQGPVFVPLPGPAKPPVMSAAMSPSGVPTMVMMVPYNQTPVPLPLRQVNLYPRTALRAPPRTPGVPFAHVPFNTQFKPVRKKSIVTAGTFNTQVPAPSLGGYRGMGDAKDDSPGFGTYAFVGLLVGTAAAMVYGATKMGKRK